MSYVIYQPNSNNRQNYNNNRRNSDYESVNFKSVFKFIGFTVLAIIALAIVYIVLSTIYIALYVETFSSISTIVNAFKSGVESSLLYELVIAAILGALAGLIIGSIRRWLKVKRHISDTFVSSVLNKKLFSFDHMFVNAVVVNMVVGLVIAAITSPVINHDLPYRVLNGYRVAFSIIANAGGGGPGGEPISSYPILLLVILVVLVQAIIVGAVIGAASYVFIGFATGLIKGTTKGLFRTAIEFDNKGQKDLSIVNVALKNACRGAVEGGIVGFIVGLIQGFSIGFAVNKKNTGNILGTILFWAFLLISIILPLLKALMEWLTNTIKIGLPNSSMTHEDGYSTEQPNDFICPMCKAKISFEIDVVTRTGILVCDKCNKVIFEMKKQ